MRGNAGPAARVDWLGALLLLVAAATGPVLAGDALRQADLFVAGLLAAAGLGMLVPRRSARAVAAALLVAAITLAIPATVSNGASPFRVISLVLAVPVGWRCWRGLRSPRPVASAPERGPAAFVALLREPRELEAPVLAKCVAEAWQTRVRANDGAADGTRVLGRSDRFLVEHRGWTIAVRRNGEPYFPDPAAVARYTRDARLRRAIEEHRGWLSLTAVYVADGSEPSDGFPLVGSLLAELLDENVLAVVSPSTRSLYAHDRGVADALRDDDPLWALGGLRAPRMLVLAEDDPRMRRAQSTARARWPEFVAAFEQRDDRDEFSVKAPFADGRHTEFVWVHVTAIENDVVYGTLGNDPLHLDRPRLADRVRVHVDDLNDWMFVRNGLVRGGFTLDVFREVADEEGKA